MDLCGPQIEKIQKNWPWSSGNDAAHMAPKNFPKLCCQTPQLNYPVQTNKLTQRRRSSLPEQV